MKPTKRIKLISEIANILGKEEWALLDLTLRQFDLPWTDQWGGNKTDYVVSMIQDADAQTLLEIASHLGVVQGDLEQVSSSPNDLKELIQKIEQQKALMIAVATGGPRIQSVNEEFKLRRIEILTILLKLGMEDPNPYADLWNLYGKWSDGSLPSYQSRRNYISSLFQPLLDNLILLSQRKTIQVVELTGWERVDRNTDKVVQSLATAKDEEDFQTVGFLCREVLISLAQVVYDPSVHSSFDGVKPSETDAKRMLENYIASELSGSSQEELRRYVKSAYNLAVFLQHKRNAGFKEAALCTEATRSLINSIAIISGQRDP